MMSAKPSGLDKKDDRPMRGKSPERDRRRGEMRYETNRMDAHSVRCRLFIGNLAAEKMSRQDLEALFLKYGHISGCSLHANFGFVQFDTEKSADEAVAKEDGKMLFGKKMDVHLVSDKKKKSGPPIDAGRGVGRGGGRSRHSPPRDRGRGDDFGRYPSRFDHPESERYGRPLSPSRHAPFREPFDRPDDYHRERYRDDPMRTPYDRRDLPPPPRGPYDDRRDPYDYPPRGDPYCDRHDDGHRDGPRRDDFRHEGPRRDDVHRDDLRHDDPRRDDPRRDDIRRDDPRRDEPRRDEPYGRYDNHSRNYQDDYGPPSKKSRPEYDDPVAKTVQAPTDCVIIVVSKVLVDYGMMVERKFKDAGLVTDLQFLGIMSMAELLDNVTRHGVLYAVVITSQHEVHHSVTVNILHGTPQEHRNMPLEDALRLVAQNFEQYMQDLRKRAGEIDTDKSKDKEKEWEREREKEKEKEREREREKEKEREREREKEREKERAREQEKERERERAREREKSYVRGSSYGTPTPPKPSSQDGNDMKKLLGKAAAGGQLSSNELSKLIENLSKQQKKVSSEGQGPTASVGGTSTSSQPQSSSDAQSIAKQQADLQAKILSILNPGTLSKVSIAGLTSAAQSASGTSISTAPNKSAGYGIPVSKTSAPLFPAAKALSASTSSTYTSGSTAAVGAKQSVSGYSSGAVAAANQYTKSGASAPSSYGVPKTATPAWYGDSKTTTRSYTFNKPTATNQAASSTYDKVPTSTYGIPKASPTSYGVPKASPTSYAVPKASPNSYGVPKASPNSYGVPKASPTSYGVPKSSPTSYGVPKTSPAIRTPSPAGRGNLSNNRGPAPSILGGSLSGSSQYGSPSGRGGYPPGSRGGILGSSPGRGMQTPQQGNTPSRGPPSGLTAVRGGPPSSMGGHQAASRGGHFQPRGLSRGPPVRGGMPHTGGLPPPPRFGLPAFRGVHPPRGAPITTVQGRGRIPPRPY